MQVLFVIDSLFTGGSEYSTLLYARWLQQQGYAVRIVLLKVKNPSYDPLAFGLQAAYVTVLQPGGFISRLLQLQKILRNYQPDLVHSVLTASNFNCRVLRMVSRKFLHIESLVNQPYAAARLQDKKLKPWKIRILQFFDRLTHTLGVDAFHANSEAVALHYCREVGVSSSRITVIPRGREDNPFVTQREQVREALLDELQIQEPCLVLINTGRHEHQKGQDVLLRAVASLSSAFNWYLLIAGREGAETAQLRHLVQQYQLEQRVRFLGHRTDVPRLLAASDLFVFPSRFEGMPGALIEACAAGLPVVCTNLPCMKEVVEPGVNARVFDAEEVSGLAQHIEVLLNDSSLRQQMGKQSLQLFTSKFQVASIHGRMEQLYQQVLSRN